MTVCCAPAAALPAAPVKPEPPDGDVLPPLFPRERLRLELPLLPAPECVAPEWTELVVLLPAATDPLFERELPATAGAEPSLLPWWLEPPAIPCVALPAPLPDPLAPDPEPVVEDPWDDPEALTPALPLFPFEALPEVPPGTWPEIWWNRVMPGDVRC